MPKLLVDSDDEERDKGGGTFKINEDYATAYEKWRSKEEYQKLKDKYGEDILSEDSVLSGDDSEDDSDESDNSEELDDTVFDEKFLKAYGALKAKDPNIYDNQTRFFDDDSKEEENQDGSDAGPKKSKVKGMNLLEYHVNLVKREKGITDEDRLMETGGNRPDKTSYVQEMADIKKEFKNILNNEDGDDGDDLIKGVKHVPVERSSKKTSGAAEVLQKAAQSDEKIGFLASYWNKKDLDKREKFLKDYILNKKYLDPADGETVPRISRKSFQPFTAPSTSSANAQSSENDEESMEEEDTEEDVKPEVSSKLAAIANAAPSYHFQEDNAEVIKRYPREVESIRSMGNSTSRSIKRSEIKERKAKEKQEALQKFRELRRAQAKEKLARLKEISGNERLLSAEDPDIDLIVDDVTNFDPEKYDQLMSKLFDEKFYDVSGHCTEEAAEGDEAHSEGKPEFDFIPGIDDVDDNLVPTNDPTEEHEAGGEDDQEEDQEEADDRFGKEKRKKQKKRPEKRKDPADKRNIGIYEDVVAGEIPTRFKYREVPANDFGLTPEELLFAEDKELNAWVSLKKASQYRPMEEEAYDIKVYGRRANDMHLKKKVLKSLYHPEGDQHEAPEEDEQPSQHRMQNQRQQQSRQPKQPSQSQGSQQRKRNHKQKPNSHPDQQQRQQQHQEPQQHQQPQQNQPDQQKRKPKRKRAAKKPKLDLTAERLKSYDLSNTKIRKLKN